MRDIVVLYLNPPDKAIVLSVDEKSQLQALDPAKPAASAQHRRPGLRATNGFVGDGHTPRVEARYAVCESMDGWLDAIDMNDAWRAQTLLSYGMNGGELPAGHGGPLRLRVPRQLGYKSLKFLKRVTLTDTLRGVAVGGDYSWYAGI